MEAVIYILSAMMVIQIFLLMILMHEVKRIQEKDRWMEKGQEQHRPSMEAKRDDEFKEKKRDDESKESIKTSG